MGYLPLGCDQVSLWSELLVSANMSLMLNSVGLMLRKHHRDRGIGYRFGGGLQYQVDENVAVRGLVRYVNINDVEDVNDMWEYSAGVRYSF